MTMFRYVTIHTDHSIFDNRAIRFSTWIFQVWITLSGMGSRSGLIVTLYRPCSERRIID